jgi:hypothetical protein
MMIGVAMAVALAACGQQPAREAPAEDVAPAVAEPAPPRPAPLTLERTVACASALDTFKGFGRGAPPAGVTPEQFADAALINLRAVELKSADTAAYDAAYATAKASWADQTPADIEAAVSACLAEIRG